MSQTPSHWTLRKAQRRTGTERFTFSISPVLNVLRSAASECARGLGAPYCTCVVPFADMIRNRTLPTIDSRVSSSLPSPHPRRATLWMSDGEECRSPLPVPTMVSPAQTLQSRTPLPSRLRRNPRELLLCGKIRQCAM